MNPYYSIFYGGEFFKKDYDAGSSVVFLVLQPMRPPTSPFVDAESMRKPAVPLWKQTVTPYALIINLKSRI